MNLPLLMHFVRQDLVDRHASSALGALWTLLLPLANILMFTLVFSRIMGARLEALGMEYLGEYSYSVYLISGLLAWNAFASSLTRITNVFQEKASLITKVHVPLMSLPLYIIISETIVYSISMSFFAIFLLLIDFEWHATCLFIPIIFAIQQLLAYGLGLLLAIFSVFLRDIRDVINIVVQFWFWMTPIVYVYSILPEGWATYLQWNPMAQITLGIRDVLILGAAPSLLKLFMLTTLGLAILILALFVGRKLEKDIRDFL